MPEYKVAVVGATGAVGEEMVSILAERDFPVESLLLLATERSAGRTMEFRGREYEVEVTTPEKFEDIDIALFSAGGGASRKLAPEAVRRGAIVIDNSSAFRMDPEVPLVVPEVNAAEIENHQGIIANPNCSTIQMVLPVKAIYDSCGVHRIVVSTYQAVSGTGRQAMIELEKQTESLLAGREYAPQEYPRQIAFNALPHIDVFQEHGYTKEEWKMVKETQKILDDEHLKVTATTVRIPVFVGHAEAVNIETQKPCPPEKARELMAAFPGIEVIDDPRKLEYPTPLDTEDSDSVLVGRIRPDLTVASGINMWVVANNLRKGAALNAVQIAEEVVERKVLQ